MQGFLDEQLGFIIETVNSSPTYLLISACIVHFLKVYHPQCSNGRNRYNSSLLKFADLSSL